MLHHSLEVIKSYLLFAFLECFSEDELEVPVVDCKVRVAQRSFEVLNNEVALSLLVKVVECFDKVSLFEEDCLRNSGSQELIPIYLPILIDVNWIKHLLDVTLGQMRGKQDTNLFECDKSILSLVKQQEYSSLLFDFLPTVASVGNEHEDCFLESDHVGELFYPAEELRREVHLRQQRLILVEPGMLQALLSIESHIFFSQHFCYKIFCLLCHIIPYLIYKSI